MLRKSLLPAILFISMQCQSAVADVLSHGLGLTIIPQHDKVIDLHERKLISQGFSVSEVDSFIPVGFAYQPYYQYNNGVGIGGGIGPVMFIGTTKGDTTDIIFTNIPVNIDVRYAYNPGDNSVEPFIKAGIRKNIANGDFVVSSKAGVYAAIGLEFNVDKAVSFSLELTIDNSEIVFEDVFGETTIEPNERMITFLVLF